MGGEREDVIETPSPKAKVSRQGVDVDAKGQILRIHESKGHVHFHADAESLKCYVPVPVWAKAWERLSNPATTDVQDFTYTDKQNKSILYVETGNYVNDDGSGYTLDATIRVHRLTDTGTVYAKLDKFTEAK